MWIGKNYIKREFVNSEEESFEKVNPSTGKVLGSLEGFGKVWGNSWGRFQKVPDGP